MRATPASPQPLDVKIELSPSDGLIRVVDPRIFGTHRRAWCLALAEAAASCPDVRAIRLDLETATCEIRFASGPGAGAAAMADVLAASMRTANEASAVATVSRRSWFSWWSTRPQTWSLLSAYPGEKIPSVWKMHVKEPGLVEIEHECLNASRSLRSRVGRGLPAGSIEPASCQLNRKTRNLEVRFEPGRFDLDQFLDEAEQVLVGSRAHRPLSSATCCLP